MRQLLANLRRLVEEDEVIALITGLADSALDYIDDKQVPTITFGVSPTAFASKYETVYPIVGNALLWTQEIIAGLDDQGILEDGMKVAMIYDSTFIDISPYLPAIEESWENAGAQVVAVDPFTLETGSCESLILKYRDLGVDWLDFQTAAWFLCTQAGEAQGWSPRLGWGGWPASVPQTAAIAEYAPDLNTPDHLDSPAVLGYWAAAKLLADAVEAQGEVVTQAGINEWIQGVEDYEIGITPPIRSMAPDCKTGSEEFWIGQWEWDEATGRATRTPATGYLTSPQKEEFGGACFLTRIFDEIIGG